jgi:uncharacterized membrane protein
MNRSSVKSASWHTRRVRYIHVQEGRTMNEQPMGPGRLVTFSDGVIAILITIMVLELKVPHGSEPELLLKVWPVFLSYALSFFIIAIYWVNHHRLFHSVKRVDNPLLWANIFWLFCISLVPFSTAYMGENYFTPFATAIYAATMLLCGISFYPMRRAVAAQFKGDAAYAAMDRRAVRKNVVSLSIYAISIPLAFVHPAITVALTFVVGGIYFLPNAWLGER